MDVQEKNYLDEPIIWNEALDAEYPYECTYDGAKFRIRVNDFPAEHLYSLLVDDTEVVSFDDWPANWERGDDGENSYQSNSKDIRNRTTIPVEGKRRASAGNRQTGQRGHQLAKAPANPAMDSTESSSQPLRYTLTSGLRLAHYEIKLGLGIGGMGEVYLAYDTKINRNVALKILPTEVAANQELRQRFVQEGRAPALLSDHNIARIYEIGEIDGINFIAMEFVEGQTLKKYMAGRKMPIGEVLGISIQVASALMAAHAVGIVHRDIKPENIMRTADGLIKVLDFGLAKLTEAKKAAVDLEPQNMPRIVTKPGVLLGTLAYMSPEQVRGKGVDPRSDIFNLGVVIYEMLAGTVPFAGETQADLMVAILEKQPGPLKDLAPSTPPKLQHIVNKALLKDREERYQSVKDLLAELLVLKQELDFTANADSIDELLQLTMREIGASSCTFYVRDAFLPDELRLIAMPGVQFAEPLFGFPSRSNRALVEGDPEIFSVDSPSDRQLREDVDWSLDQIDPEKRLLYGDFVEREGIRSSARLVHTVNGRIEAVLFVNFSQTVSFGDPLKGKLKALLARCISNLPALHEEIRASGTDELVQTIRMFSPIYEASTKLYEWDQPLELYLISFLRVALEALELDASTAFGTIHAYDRKTQTLRLAAHVGGVDVEHAESLSVATGQGIVSWVAIRRKALLISDFTKSRFASIQIPINLDKDKKVRSEVAIPIFARETLVGVLNLESFLPNAFRPMCVRSLWFAVSQAAVAQKLLSSNDRIKFLIDRLLELCREAVRKGNGFWLSRLAALAAEELEAARCHIWRYDEPVDEFEFAGVQSPRSGGLSRFILQLFRELNYSLDAGAVRSAWPVWISRKNDGEDIEVQCWNGESWSQPPSHLKLPDKMSPSVSKAVKSLLGIPIKGRLDCIGLAWLEYERDLEKPLVNELMKLATVFADYAGMVIEFSQIDFVEQDALRRIGGQLSEQLVASGPLHLKGFPSIEGYVISEPFQNSRIGGDFHAGRVIDKKTAVVLVGDGQGHAVTGALNMLPMLTTFEAFWKESRSATHMMDKIRSISNNLGVRGTAVYCVFTLVEKKLWLSVTAASHPYLVIIRKVGAEAFLYLPGNDGACGPMLGVPSVSGPIIEAHTDLFSGDAIIIFSDGLGMDVDEVTRVGLAHKTEDPKSIAEAIFAKALDGSESLDDDATVLVLRVK
jgi:serine/threonine protein kinase/putative methionine-R-sulfoxide reductase with GAF domain